MGSKTNIEWTDATWNPVSGCSKVSDGCTNCYAEAMARRFDKGWKPWIAGNATHNVRLHHEKLEQPLHWRKPKKIFVCSVSDLFHECVPDEFIAHVFSVIVRARKHVFQILTKRPKRMNTLLTSLRFSDSVSGSIARILPRRIRQHWYYDPHEFEWPLCNLWLGVTAEDQRTADERIPLLLQTPAAVRFVSIEPMLGPILLDAPGRPWLTTEIDHEENTKLDWVIVGGESGPKARPPHPAWVRSIRDQCQAAGVPFFFKQWGHWALFLDNGPLPNNCSYVGIDGTIRAGDSEDLDYDECMGRVGKKAAGRELDGRTYEEVPQ